MGGTSLKADVEWLDWKGTTTNTTYKKIPKVGRLVSEHGHRVKYNISEGFYISVSLKMQMLNFMSLQGDQTIKKEKKTTAKTALPLLRNCNSLLLSEN